MLVFDDSKPVVSLYHERQKAHNDNAQPLLSPTIASIENLVNNFFLYH